MKYKKVKKAEFLSRPNRFIANVMLDGEILTVHVKNTGRCKELLTPGAIVFLSESEDVKRKTKFDLIAVKKGERLINMDSQAPNKVAPEYIKRLIPELTLIKPEVKYKNSRFDFYAETPTDKWFIEVKGVTLEENGVVMFPDAPTKRGEKHIHELMDATEDGYKTMVLFIVQMENVRYFTPNYKTHESFGTALATAKEKGVKVEAVTCTVTPDSLEVGEKVEIILR